MRSVTAAILTGGLGTRLRGALPDRPKGLAPVGGRPFLAYLLDLLADAGVDSTVLCTGHLAEQFPAALGSAHRGMPLTYSQESSPLGTGGALRLALPRLTTEHVLVLNGDSYCDVDLCALRKAHQTRRADGTVVLARVDDVRRFGRVRQDNEGRITRFAEKAALAGPGWINAGIYLLRRSLLRGIPKGVPLSLERDCFPRWISRRLCGYPSAGRFLDIGTPESYAQAERFFEARRS